MRIDDWNLQTPEYISSQFKGQSQLVLNALNTLTHFAGEYVVEEIDFGYTPADIYSPSQIEGIVKSLDPVSETGDTVPKHVKKWFSELKAALK